MIEKKGVRLDLVVEPRLEAVIGDESCMATVFENLSLMRLDIPLRLEKSRFIIPEIMTTLF